MCESGTTALFIFRTKRPSFPLHVRIGTVSLRQLAMMAQPTRLKGNIFPSRFHDVIVDIVHTRHISSLTDLPPVRVSHLPLRM